MKDLIGRNIDYVRVSVTDRCNLRCVYCMPEEGIKSASHNAILTYDEIVRICREMAGLGISKVKLTGGEPLVRKGLPELVKALKAVPGIEKVTLTTNGILLEKNIDSLAKAGLDAVNISLDTKDDHLFQEITRRDLCKEALAGIEAVGKYPDIRVKINCVPLGRKEQDLLEIAEMARDGNIHVRFIEMMPIGFGKQFGFTSEEEILALLQERFGPAAPFAGDLGNGPGHYYTLGDFRGKIGFISAISHKFCESCNRIRMTSQGYLKSCLQYDVGGDLRELIRGGCTDEELRAAIMDAIERKPLGHEFLSQSIEGEDKLFMAQIGG